MGGLVDPVKLLEAGFSGLSFLLVWLAFLLLRDEQRKRVARARVERMIYVFIAFALIIALMNLIEAAGLIAGAAGSD